MSETSTFPGPNLSVAHPHTQNLPSTSKSQRSRRRQNTGQARDQTMTPVNGLSTAGVRSGSMTGGDRAHGSGKTRAPGQPLRRGDACLMCRAKKLKCSAKKPVCDQCSKRKDRCVYDDVRPASRVERLERRLAEIEEQELQEALQARRLSQGVYCPGPSTIYSLPFPTPLIGGDNRMALIPTVGSAIDHSLLGNQNDSVQSTYDGLSPQILTTDQDANIQRTHLATNSSLWPQPKVEVISPPPAAHLAPVHNPDLEFDQSAWPILSASGDFSHNWSSPSQSALESHSESRGSFSSDETIVDYFAAIVDNGPHKAIPKLANLDHFNGIFPLDRLPLVDLSVFDRCNQSALPVAAEIPQESTNFGLNDISGLITGDGITGVDGQLTESAKGYLLTLFFGESPPRPHFGSEVFTYAQFQAKMLLPENMRPHSCLIYSMYTIASSSSYIPAIRSLSNALLAMTAVKIEEAISQEDRLVDAINASKNLSKWLFSQSRWLEGYQYSWKALSLCMACGLHQIPSSIFTPHEINEKSKTRKALLPPPTSQWELCERIHAFWSAWGNERGRSFWVPWPSAISDENVTTPLPRPPEDFQDGKINSQPDITLRDVYELPFSKCPPRLDFFYGYYFVAVHLLHRARRLRHRLPEVQNTYRAINRKSPSRPGLPSPKRDHPQAYMEIMGMVAWVEETIPAQWKVRVNETPCWDNPDVPVMFLLLLSTRLNLHPLNGDENEREVSLSTIHKAASLIKLWIIKIQVEQEQAAADENLLAGGLMSAPNVLLTSSRNKNGLSGPYWSIGWERIANLSKQGAEVLMSLGRMEEAQQFATDGEEISQAIQMFGIVTPFSG
ncbi:hypothetical protein IAR55_001891 [Kwoniella newhampshirensis]|uniref:Zn(2)-C6 fungal-type domain-containing protein n=1 Tax=Kwoniella newhampshirensis TaxID=1651941 RepID=A0AAW0Z3I2_9TREE